jgi:hypothetical protein
LKPSDFYVGIISFFSILVPGAVAAALLKPLLGVEILGPVIPVPASEAGKWAAFLVTSYFLGHLIFLCGAYIDPFYDRIRKRRNPYNNESAYQCATQIRLELLKGDENKAVSTFQWSRAILTALFPGAAGHVHELEADSKFFRSLLIVLLIAGAVLLAHGLLIEGVVALLFIGPCFGRYYERRLKSTTQAYVYMISLHRLGKLDSLQVGPPNPATPADA